eukprot:10940577-Alexandrium_andersonii.AAC.1
MADHGACKDAVRSRIQGLATRAPGHNGTPRMWGRAASLGRSGAARRARTSLWNARWATMC